MTFSHKQRARRTALEQKRLLDAAADALDVLLHEEDVDLRGYRPLVCHAHRKIARLASEQARKAAA